MSGSMWLSLRNAKTRRPECRSTAAISCGPHRVLVGLPDGQYEFDPSVVDQTSLTLHQGFPQNDGDEILVYVGAGFRRPAARVLAQQMHH
jgi:hypothetical protein